MSLYTTSFNFFVTIRPPNGVGSELKEPLQKFLLKNYTHYIVCEEGIFNERHIHLVCRSNVARRLDRVNRSWKSFLESFYPAVELKVLTALTKGCIWYTLKEHNIWFERGLGVLQQFIESEKERSRQVAEQEKAFRDQKIRFAYYSRRTWASFFRQYKEVTGLVVSFDVFERQLFCMNGKTGTAYSRRFFYNQYVSPAEPKHDFRFHDLLSDVLENPSTETWDAFRAELDARKERLESVPRAGPSKDVAVEEDDSSRSSNPVLPKRRRRCTSSDESESD
ncbi:hypothetical protein GWI33_002736 [Rhynchophorus ferrugineus]|uniref:Uncharacterized protein n=1 Tax=Rhynchophorus ferrugineus TaxID=354439 RepID=A0A834M0Q9_RHYFE|nr:hypothetical protein GWI33_003080 [Rhynchophorus ferrugineus]KAF7263356.1 hypothetical protein GWI33_002736 [Rhynchophorus ferrugineus]